MRRLDPQPISLIHGPRPKWTWTFGAVQLASLPSLLALRKSHPCFKYPRFMCVHEKTKERSQQTSKEMNKEDKESMQRTYYQRKPNGGKQSMLSIWKRQTSMLSNKKGCPRRTNVGLDWVSVVPLDWSMDEWHTDLCIKKYGSVQQESIEARIAKRVAQSKQGKHINIARSGESCRTSTQTSRRCISEMVTSKQTLGRMDITTQAQTHRGHRAWQSLDLER